MTCFVPYMILLLVGSKYVHTFRANHKRNIVHQIFKNLIDNLSIKRNIDRVDYRNFGRLFSIILTENSSSLYILVVLDILLKHLKIFTHTEIFVRIFFIKNLPIKILLNNVHNFVNQVCLRS